MHVHRLARSVRVKCEMLDYSAMRYVQICREMGIIGMVSLVKYKIKQQHLGNTLTTTSMCNISSVYIMHVMII